MGKWNVGRHATAPRSREELMAVVVLGLIMLIAAGALTAAVVTSNTGAIETNLWGLTISNLSAGAVFVAGMLTTVVAVLGLMLLMMGARRNRRRHQERRALRRENQRLTQQVETGPPTGDGAMEDTRRPELDETRADGATSSTVAAERREHETDA